MSRATLGTRTPDLRFTKPNDSAGGSEGSEPAKPAGGPECDPYERRAVESARLKATEPEPGAHIGRKVAVEDLATLVDWVDELRARVLRLEAALGRAIEFADYSDAGEFADSLRAELRMP